ncbi:hypothetical protein [Streptomyces sp. NPDC002676]
MRRAGVWSAAAVVTAVSVAAATTAHAEGRGDIRVVKTVVDHGTNVVVGTSKTIEFPIVMTIRDDSGVKGVTHLAAFSVNNGSGDAEWTGTSCTKSSSTTSVCTATMRFVPVYMADNGGNASAGVYQVNATVKANDGDYWISDDIARFKVQRASKLVTDASPEPVAKGGKLTVTGSLTRANWEDLKYHGYGAQDVKLQYKKTGSSSYSTVKTVVTDAAGKLRTTVIANASGTWRWYFPGTTTTARVTSPGDTVTVR